MQNHQRPSNNGNNRQRHFPRQQHDRTPPPNNKSPYNFVPLSETIVFPDWGDKVSQDIPFSDHLDGELDLTIEALSPLFIRNGVGEKSTSTDDFFFYKDSTGKAHYCLPGTSLKGMIRSVMEIASFGKLQHINDQHYAIRDLHNQQYCQTIRNAQAGWLDISEEDNWKIYPCKFALWDRTKGCSQLRISADYFNKQQTAAQKYIKFDQLTKRQFEQNANVEKATGVNNWGKPIKRPDEAIFSETGQCKGKVVFTGQPQEYSASDFRKAKNKHHEFFFYGDSNKPFPVDAPTRKAFLDIHTELTATTDWDNWIKNKELLAIRKDCFGGRIPIFYLRSNDGMKLRFGLAMMFRFAGEVSVGEAARNSNKDHFPMGDEPFTPDLADLVFGFATPKKALRGRVQFSVAEAVGEVKPLPAERVILGTPKPTFHPAYLQQPLAKNGLLDKKDYVTFLDGDAKLRGWKRYPVLNNAKFIPPEKASDKTYTSFCALPQGTKFQSKVRYHNLRPVELGALLWCIQMNPTESCHSLGMAKPYGYGKVKLKIDGLTDEQIEKYKEKFIDYMNERLSGSGMDFKTSPQISALLAMAKFDGAKPDWDFHYFSLDEYRNFKATGQVLKEYPR